jgi:hypothetical protein
MASASQKITLSASRDIPFDKLLLSACNVRRIKAGVSIQELADDIARRSLLQSLTVRPVLDAEGQETGLYEIPAGGRRYRALELLVRQKRLAAPRPSSRHMRGGAGAKGIGCPTSGGRGLPASRVSYQAAPGRLRRPT